ncbi:MAG: hypothetical protein ACLSVD_09035 [Eggerthellaceae bacterium]
MAVHVTTARNGPSIPRSTTTSCCRSRSRCRGRRLRRGGRGATIAQSGEDATAAFTVLPGQDADFTLTAKVRNFKMPGAQIAALPYSSVVEMPDTSSMVSGMTTYRTRSARWRRARRRSPRA